MMESLYPGAASFNKSIIVKCCLESTITKCYLDHRRKKKGGLSFRKEDKILIMTLGGPKVANMHKELK